MAQVLFQEEDSNSTDYAPRNAQGRLQGDEKLIVKFSTVVVKNQVASEEEKRNIFMELPFITIKSPGDQNSVIETLSTEAYEARFPLDFENYKKGIDATLIGTPLTEWNGIRASDAEELKHFHILTVEQLANIGDELTKRKAGLPTLKIKAASWLVSQADGAVLLQKQAEVEKRDAEIAELRQMITEISSSKSRDVPNTPPQPASTQEAASSAPKFGKYQAKEEK
jgi:hypothetical protein